MDKGNTGRFTPSTKVYEETQGFNCPECAKQYSLGYKKGQEAEWSEQEKTIIFLQKQIQDLIDGKITADMLKLLDESKKKGDMK